jgi:thiol-disulfide isomerase/thioredoxin
MSEQLQGQLLRILAAGAAVGFLVLILWQAGILFRPAGEDVSFDDGRVISVRPANVALETPNPLGLRVGLGFGDLAPDFEFSNLDGERMRLSDFRGQVVFLNFWATWCAPCRIEMPEIMTIQEKYADQVAVIALNNGEAHRPASRFIDNLELNFAAVAMDPTQEIVRRYQVYGMPTSFFIDAEGVITRVHEGQINLRIMEAAVQEALEGVARSEAR